MIETRGLVALIEGTDAMLKAANVELAGPMQQVGNALVTAVVVGGVAIFGGSGSVVGAALGALLLQTINSSLNVIGISSIWTEAISGLLLIAAITLDRGIQLRVSAALRRRRVRLGA